MKVYISGLGYRHPINDKDQIIWYLQQVAKGKHKSQVTRFWLDMKEAYSTYLLKNEAFELLEFLKDKVTTLQEERRIANRKKAQDKADLEFQNFKKEYQQRKLNQNLINGLSDN